MSRMTILFKLGWCKRGKGGRERERRESERKVAGFGLMTPGLSMDIRCHV